MNLYVTGVQHNSDCGAQSAAGEVVPELGTDGARVAVGAGDAAPDASVGSGVGC